MSSTNNVRRNDIIDFVKGKLVEVVTIANGYMIEITNVLEQKISKSTEADDQFPILRSVFIDIGPEKNLGESEGGEEQDDDITCQLIILFNGKSETLQRQMNDTIDELKIFFKWLQLNFDFSEFKWQGATPKLPDNTPNGELTIDFIISHSSTFEDLRNNGNIKRPT